MTDLPGWWPAFLAAGTFLVAILVFVGLRRRDLGARRRSPFAEDFLRAPGHGLRANAEASARSVFSAELFATTWPLLVFGAWAAAHWLGGLPAGPALDLGAAAVLVLGWLAGLSRVTREQSRFRRLRMALDGEIATAQVLGDLSAEGCRVLHDVPTPAGRLSHVVVAPSAVFAIRTLARRRSHRGRGKEDVTVYVTGDELKFPDGTDLAAVPRARRSAMALAEALKPRLGRTVEVRPVVFLPGWYVDCRVGSDVQVMNPRETARLVAGPPVHGPDSVEAIAGAAAETGRPDGPAPAKPRPAAPERREPTF